MHRDIDARSHSHSSVSYKNNNNNKLRVIVLCAYGARAYLYPFLLFSSVPSRDFLVQFEYISSKYFKYKMSKLGRCLNTKQVHLLNTFKVQTNPFRLHGEYIYKYTRHAPKMYVFALVCICLMTYALCTPPTSQSTLVCTLKNVLGFLLGINLANRISKMFMIISYIFNEIFHPQKNSFVACFCRFCSFAILCSTFVCLDSDHYNMLHIVW